MPAWTPNAHANCWPSSESASSTRSQVTRATRTRRARPSPTPATRATELYQDELDDALADDLREQLAAVERAEARLAAGTYGLSVESGQPIPDERLEALPTAELTTDEERARG